MLLSVRVRHYLKFMQGHLCSADEILAGSNLTPDDLERSDCYVDAAQCNIVASNVLRLTGDPGIGFEIGAAAGLQDFESVGAALSSAETLGRAVRLWARYASPPISLNFGGERQGIKGLSSWSVEAINVADDEDIFRFYAEESFGVGMNLGNLLGTPLEVQEVYFSFPEHHRARYEDHFHCKVQFNAARTMLRVGAPSLNARVAYRSSTRSRERPRHLVTLRLRGVLIGSDTMPRLDDAASMLHMSSRSLRRHLQTEGTSYQAVLDEVRCVLAKEYLLEQSMPIAKVATLLGFSHPDGLRRAFKHSTGSTIGELVVPPPRRR